MSEIVLAIDTAKRVSVGLARDEQVLSTWQVGDTRSHVEQLIPTIEQALDRAGLAFSDVDRIGVGVGPGPFTGLRVGIATAQTLGLAGGIPVVGVCSLDVIALQRASQNQPGQFVALLDARRHEVYWALYDASGLRLDGPHVGPADQLPALPVVELDVDAGLLAASLDLLPSIGLEPLYLRQPDADLPSTRKSTIVGGRLRLPIAGGHES